MKFEEFLKIEKEKVTLEKELNHLIKLRHSNTRFSKELLDEIKAKRIELNKLSK